MAYTTVNGGPRMTYEKPTEKKMLGQPPVPTKQYTSGADHAEEASNAAYRLPVVDVDESRRNFDGYQVEQFWTQEDLLGPEGGDSGGTTETDSRTEENYSNESGYTKFNRKSGGPGRSWKTSAKTKMHSTEKSRGVRH